MRYKRKDIEKFQKVKETNQHKIISFFNDASLTLDTKLKDLITFYLDEEFNPKMDVSTVSNSTIINFTKDDIREIKAWIIKIEDEL